MRAVCGFLRSEVSYYDWAGFYRVGSSGNTLLLGPYDGAPTEHIKIPFGRGVCGRAAEKIETIIVQDVGREDNYISCSMSVKAEIVVPVLNEGLLKGVLDIDSHTLNPFSETDRLLLEEIAAGIAPLL